jgi:hypothetical protein
VVPRDFPSARDWYGGFHKLEKNGTQTNLEFCIVDRTSAVAEIVNSVPIVLKIVGWYATPQLPVVELTESSPTPPGPADTSASPVTVVVATLFKPIRSRAATVVGMIANTNP